jgi:hypothetical protein
MINPVNENGNITVIPLSGLANRLRVVATSIKLARESNKELRIYWQANKYLNAEFQQLFEIPETIAITTPPFKYLLLLRARSISRKLTKISMWYLRLFQFDFIFLDSMAEQVWHNKINLQKEVAQSKDVFICSCQELNYFDLEDYKLFIPKLELLNIIEEISNQFSPYTIGIHIRSTDNQWSKQNSPFNLFVEKIKQEISANPKFSFFVATDNEQYQKALIHDFGTEKIICYEKEFRRDVTKGIKDAVIDLFCLSKTAKIYGSYFSSFSYVAGRIGQIPVHILKRKLVD